MPQSVSAHNERLASNRGHQSRRGRVTASASRKRERTRSVVENRNPRPADAADKMVGWLDIDLGDYDLDTIVYEL